MQIINSIFILLQLVVLARIILGFVVQYMAMQGGGAPPILARLYDVVFAVTEPVLAPIRRLLPQTGMIDFSPLVVIIVLAIIQQVLRALI